SFHTPVMLLSRKCSSRSCERPHKEAGMGPKHGDSCVKIRPVESSSRELCLPDSLFSLRAKHSRSVNWPMEVGMRPDASSSQGKNILSCNAADKTLENNHSPDSKLFSARRFCNNSTLPMLSGTGPVSLLL